MRTILVLASITWASLAYGGSSDRSSGSSSSAPPLPQPWKALQPAIHAGARVDHATDSCLEVHQGPGAPDYEATLAAFRDAGCTVLEDEGRNWSSYGLHRFVARIDASCVGMEGAIVVHFEDAKKNMAFWLSVDGAKCPDWFLP